MEFTVQRRPTSKVATIGELRFAGQRFVDTLEDEIREIPGVPVAAWKIPKKTAIPAGRYRVVKHLSPTMGMVLMLVGVPGYTYVYFHAGNRAVNTDGCLLVGAAIPDATDGWMLAGGTSAPARAALEGKLFPLLDAGEECWCTVVNPITERAM